MNRAFTGVTPHCLPSSSVVPLFNIFYLFFFFLFLNVRLFIRNFYKNKPFLNPDFTQFVLVPFCFASWDKTFQALFWLLWFVCSGVKARWQRCNTYLSSDIEQNIGIPPHLLAGIMPVLWERKDSWLLWGTVNWICVCLCLYVTHLFALFSACAHSLNSSVLPAVFSILFIAFPRAARWVHTRYYAFIHYCETCVLNSVPTCYKKMTYSWYASVCYILFMLPILCIWVLFVCLF